jgi:uncharacterized hydrophobic protein (TIGR00271 family)
LTLGQTLLAIKGKEGKVVALRIMREKPTEEIRRQTEKQLQSMTSKLSKRAQIVSTVTASSNTKTEILQKTADFDVLVLGLSDEGFLAETDFSGLPVDIAGHSEKPTLLVKRSEAFASYWLRRSWDLVAAVLPKLSPMQRATVGTEMQHHAVADVDFYVLMLLAASIALFGLLQDSAAVIIGAMLVAPLMSPILAMSHSIVRGQVSLFRQAADSTTNGIVLAIAVGTLLTLLLVSFGIPIPPTAQILARTQPNLLDLLVALASGAAAAYAISRSEVGAALPGVAIAAALVPPLTVAGYGLGTAQFEIAAGSLILFATNLAAIILSAAVVFLLLGFRPPTQSDRDEQARSGLRMAIIALVLIALPLVATTYTSSQQATQETIVTSILEQNWNPASAEVDDIFITDSRNVDLIVSFTIYDYTDSVHEQSLAELQQELSNALDETVVLEVRTINARSDRVDDKSSARILTQTPTPTAEEPAFVPTVTPSMKDDAPLAATAEPVPAAPPAPSLLATATAQP